MTRYFHIRDRVPDLWERDVIVCIFLGVMYLFGPRIYQVLDSFNSIGEFYIDQYGTWIWKNYIILFAIVITPAAYVACATKLVEMAIRRRIRLLW